MFCALATLLVAPRAAGAATSDIVRLRDLPSGWQTEPVAPSDRTAPATAACAALAEQQRKSVVSVGTPKFVDPRTPSELDVVAATDTTMPSARAAREQVGALLDGRLLRCLIEDANHRFESEHPGTDATTVVRRVHIPRTDSHVHSIRALTTVSGLEGFEYTQDITFVRNGKHVVTLHVEHDQEADLTKLRNRLVRVIERRLRGATSVTI
jgi:hypothetical protein